MIKYDRYPGGKRFAATFSYDDGPAGDRRLVEIFNKYNMKATFNLISSSLLREGGDGVKAHEVNTLYAGHEIACHTYSHPHLEKMSIKDQYDEIIRDREILESLCGRLVRGLAYPFGTFGEDTHTAMKTASIVYGRTAVSKKSFLLPDDFLVWDPTTHHNECEASIKSFIYSVEKAPWRAGNLLYIWGHSYELAAADTPVGFEKFEELIKPLAEHSGDIWFATNIEIYNYINAQKALLRSADGKTIHNPTDTDVWVSNDDTALEIPKCGTVII